jgi:hypothetical protein
LRTRRDIGIRAGVEKTVTEPAPHLFYFKATPDQILPFGSSTLSWDAALPDAYDLFLNNVLVPQAGERLVQPAATATYLLTAIHGGTSDALGAVTVSVDTSQCVQQVAQDIANHKSLGVYVLDVFQTGFAQRGHPIFGKYPVPVSVTPGLIAFDFQATFKAYAINFAVKGKFGLTVTADQLAPINESSQVNCSASGSVWASAIIFGVMAGVLVGEHLGVWGAIIGAIIGAVLGAAGVAVVVAVVGSNIKAAMPAIYQAIVQQVIATWFSQPAGMAMAAVSIQPDPALPPDGNITVTYCPKALP